MKIAFFLMVLCTVTTFSAAQKLQQLPQASLVLKAPQVKGSGHADVDMAKGTIAVYGNPNQIVQLSSLSVSDDGSLLVAGATPGTIDIWSLSKKKLLATVQGSDVAAISHDGSLFATGEFAVYETQTMRQLCKSTWHGDRGDDVVNRISFSPDGRYLAVIANGSDLLIYSSKSCAKLATLQGTHDGAFTADSSRIIAANYQAFTVWEAGTWKQLGSFPAGPDYTTGLVVSPNSEFALVGGPNSARLVRISDGKVMRILGDGWVSGLGFLNNHVVLVRDHVRLALYTIEGEPLCSDEKLETGVMDLSAGGSFVAGAAHQRDVLIWSHTALAQACSP